MSKTVKLKKFRVYMDELIIEAKDRDDAVDQVGEMIMPSPCGLFNFEEIDD